MFIETHYLTNENSPILAFLPSNLVQAFPCGRRRGQPDKKTTFIPFDPEARLNTEANNRKHTGINGFASSYIKNLELNGTARKAIFSIVLAGYFFQIEVAFGTNDNISIETLISKFIEDIKPVEDVDKIFANIKIEKMQLFSEDTEGASEEYKNYKTAVLAPQQKVGDAQATCLDLLVSQQSAQTVDIENSNNYYFSGLSFSTTPIADFIKDNGEVVKYNYTIDVPPVINADGNQYVSLCILKKNDNIWQLNQSAFLPNIQHGDTEGSTKVSILEADEVVRDGVGVATVELDEQTNNIYTLKIFTKKKQTD